MTNEEKLRFRNSITKLFLAFNVEMKSIHIDVYLEALGDLPIESIEHGVREVIRNESEGYKPVPGKIRAAARGNVEVLAMGAWKELNAAIMRFGSYRTPKFADSRIAAIVKQHGGWVAICQMPANQFDTWFRKSFFADFETVTVDEHALPMLGISDRHNQVLGVGDRVGDIVNRGQKRLEG